MAESSMMPDAPPTYEQALHHPRLETGFTMPPHYMEYDDPFSSHHYGNRSSSGRGGRARSTERFDPRYDTFAFVPNATNIHAARTPRSQGYESHGGGSQRGVRGQSRGHRRRSDPMVVLDDNVSTTSSSEGGESCIKMTLIPMNKPMAVVCLICNVLVPGLGTILSGLCVFCCLKNGPWSLRRKVAACALNIGIGMAQLLLVPLILLGWVWSILWGFAFLGLAVEESYGKHDQDDCQSTDGEILAPPPRQRHPQSPMSSSTDMQSAASIHSSRPRPRPRPRATSVQVEPLVHAPHNGGTSMAASRRRARSMQTQLQHQENMVIETASDFPVTETEAHSMTSQESRRNSQNDSRRNSQNDTLHESSEEAEDGADTRANYTRSAITGPRSEIPEDAVIMYGTESEWETGSENNAPMSSQYLASGENNPTLRITPRRHPSNAYLVAESEQDGGRLSSNGTVETSATPWSPEGVRELDEEEMEDLTEDGDGAREVRIASASSRGSAHLQLATFGVAPNDTMASISM